MARQDINQAHADALLAAIDYVIALADGDVPNSPDDTFDAIEWLRLCREGDTAAMAELKAWREKLMPDHTPAPVPTEEMRETISPSPCHAPDQKVAVSLGFDKGTLHVKRQGYAEQNGTGYFVFKEENLDWGQDDGPLIAVVHIAQDDLIFLRDHLNELFPGALAETDATARREERERCAKVIEARVASESAASRKAAAAGRIITSECRVAGAEALHDAANAIRSLPAEQEGR